MEVNQVATIQQQLQKLREEISQQRSDISQIRKSESKAVGVQRQQQAQLTRQRQTLSEQGKKVEAKNAGEEAVPTTAAAVAVAQKALAISQQTRRMQRRDRSRIMGVSDESKLYGFLLERVPELGDYDLELQNLKWYQMQEMMLVMGKRAMPAFIGCIKSISMAYYARKAVKVAVNNTLGFVGINVTDQGAVQNNLDPSKLSLIYDFLSTRMYDMITAALDYIGKGETKEGQKKPSDGYIASMARWVRDKSVAVGSAVGSVVMSGRKAAKDFAKNLIKQIMQFFSKSGTMIKNFWNSCRIYIVGAGTVYLLHRLVTGLLNRAKTSDDEREFTTQREKLDSL